MNTPLGHPSIKQQVSVTLWLSQVHEFSQYRRTTLRCRRSSSPGILDSIPGDPLCRWSVHPLAYNCGSSVDGSLVWCCVWTKNPMQLVECPVYFGSLGRLIIERRESKWQSDGRHAIKQTRQDNFLCAILSESGQNNTHTHTHIYIYIYTTEKHLNKHRPGMSGCRV